MIMEVIFEEKIHFKMPRSMRIKNDLINVSLLYLRIQVSFTSNVG